MWCRTISRLWPCSSQLLQEISPVLSRTKTLKIFGFTRMYVVYIIIITTQTYVINPRILKRKGKKGVSSKVKLDHSHHILLPLGGIFRPQNLTHNHNLFHGNSSSSTAESLMVVNITEHFSFFLSWIITQDCSLNLTDTVVFAALEHMLCHHHEEIK